MPEPHFKFWGWGLVGEGLSEAEARALGKRTAAFFGIGDLAHTAPPRVEEIRLAPPRISPPARLADICSSTAEDRLIHTYGKSFPDSVHAFTRRFPNAPDTVARPRSEKEVVAVLDWADETGAAVIPFGGGSSVVGGVEPRFGNKYSATITLNLQRLNRVIEVDPISRTARIQGGILGPDLENQLARHGLTLRHFPQSFQFSTLGGWIATRSGGHFATLYTHIDDLVENTRVVTPAGVAESRRLPGSGAGPSPDRLFIGSEGTLGVITEAWMRLQKRPTFRASAAVHFSDYTRAVEAVRIISQAGLYPANCRLIDAEEAADMGAGNGSKHLLVLAFENADHPVQTWLDRALEIAADHDGSFDKGAAEKTDSHRAGAAGAWRDAFLRAPYFREVLTGLGVISDTFETAITWDRFAAFHTGVKEATANAIKAVTGRPGRVTCRFTHVYPDGPAPYFSFRALGRREAMIEEWQAIKNAASDALIRLGGTITHHHAVGRDHRPWYDQQRPELFASALRAAKQTLDPKGLMNPGVLIDP